MTQQCFLDTELPGMSGKPVPVNGYFPDRAKPECQKKRLWGEYFSRNSKKELELAYSEAIIYMRIDSRVND